MNERAITAQKNDDFTINLSDQCLYFDAIDPASFPEAFRSAMAEHMTEVAAIAENPAAPGFFNTLAAMERSGRRLDSVARTFFALAGAHTNAELQAAEREISPALSRHASAIALNAGLFARVDALAENSDEKSRMAPEDVRLLERVHSGFVRGGANLQGGDRERLAEIDAELASLGTRFAQNILADERDWLLPLATDDLSGLPEFLVSSMAGVAAERGIDGYGLTLSRSLVVPFLTYSDRRDLRETAFRAWTSRGENDGPSDNRQIMADILRLRGEKAKLLGYQSYAAYKLDDQMAKTPGAVRTLLEEVWDHAKTRAAEDAEALRALAEIGRAHV